MSPRLGLSDIRSPRGTHTQSVSDTMNQKKLGTRIANLESQLGDAQTELKILKVQLTSAETAKKEAQEKLDQKVKKNDQLNAKGSKLSDDINDNLQETDVFEVPKRELQEELVLRNDQSLQKSPVDESEANKLAEIYESSKILTQELVMKDEEISCLKVMLTRRDTELKVISEENDLIKMELSAAKAEILLAETKVSEMGSKLNLLTEELQASRDQTSILNEKLQSVERGKVAMEVEIKQLRIQTEQWRKAADAAAAVLACDADMNGGRISDRCGSMGKSFPGVMESPVGGYVGSPELGSGKRRGSGIKMFGDMWKKKGHSK